MTFKSILVHADPGPGCNSRIRLALDVADLFDASITGLGAEAFDPVLLSGYAAADGMVIQAIRDRIAMDLPAAEKHFRALTEGREPVGWVAGEDYPDKLLALHARSADLIVASRPARGEGPSYAARPTDLVMEAGCPVLLAADGDRRFRGENVVVAWKDSRESRRAVTDALPFLARAKSVTVVAVCGEADGHANQAGLKDVALRLTRHGIRAGVESVPKGHASVTKALEDAADRHDADLIIVGAYGHSRLREWALGGVTEDLIVSSSKFILLSH